MNGVDYSCFRPVKSAVEKCYAKSLAITLQHIVSKTICDAAHSVASWLLKSAQGVIREALIAAAVFVVGNAPDVAVVGAAGVVPEVEIITEGEHRLA